MFQSKPLNRKCQIIFEKPIDNSYASHLSKRVVCYIQVANTRKKYNIFDFHFYKSEDFCEQNLEFFANVVLDYFAHVLSGVDTENTDNNFYYLLSQWKRNTPLEHHQISDKLINFLTNDKVSMGRDEIICLLLCPESLSTTQYNTTIANIKKIHNLTSIESRECFQYFHPLFLNLPKGHISALQSGRFSNKFFYSLLNESIYNFWLKDLVVQQKKFDSEARKLKDIDGKGFKYTPNSGLIVDRIDSVPQSQLLRNYLLECSIIEYEAILKSQKLVKSLSASDATRIARDIVARMNQTNLGDNQINENKRTLKAASQCINEFVRVLPNGESKELYRKMRGLTDLLYANAPGAGSSEKQVVERGDIFFVLNKFLQSFDDNSLSSKRDGDIVALLASFKKYNLWIKNTNLANEVVKVLQEKLDWEEIVAVVLDVSQNGPLTLPQWRKYVDNLEEFRGQPAVVWQLFVKQ